MGLLKPPIFKKISDIEASLGEKVNYYDSIASMKADTNLKDGQKCVTTGYYSANDGGGATYKISVKGGSDVDNGGDLLILDNNNLKATIISNKSKQINILQWGVKADGVTDVSARVQEIFNLPIWFMEVYFPAGNYLFGNIITTNKALTIIGDEVALTTVDMYRTVFIFNDIPNVELVDKYVFTLYGQSKMKNILFQSNSYNLTEDRASFLASGDINVAWTETITTQQVCGLSVGVNSSIENLYFKGFSGTTIYGQTYSNFKSIHFSRCNKCMIIDNDNVVENIRADFCRYIFYSIGSMNIISNIRGDSIRSNGFLIYGTDNNLSNIIIDWIYYNTVILASAAHRNNIDINCARCGVFYYDRDVANGGNVDQKASCVQLYGGSSGNTIRLTGGKIMATDTASEHYIYTIGVSTVNEAVLGNNNIFITMSDITDFSSLAVLKRFVLVQTGSCTGRIFANGKLINLNNLSLTTYNSSTIDMYLLNKGVLSSSDFLNTSDISPWGENLIGSGTIANVASTAKHPGVISLSSSVSADSGASIKIAESSLLLKGGEKTTFIFKGSSTLTGVTRRLGFHNATSVTAPTDGVYCRIIDGVITGHTVNNNTLSTTGTNYTITADTWYRLVIELNSTGAIATYTLYADDSDTVLWTNTLSTNIPTTRVTSHGDICTYSGTSAIVIGYLDYIDIVLPNSRRV